MGGFIALKVESRDCGGPDHCKAQARGREKVNSGVMGMAGEKILQWVAVVVACLLWYASQAEGIRFVIDKKECWAHEVVFDGDTVHVSFVVIKYEHSWNAHQQIQGLDLIVEAPAGHHIHTVKQKTEQKFEFIAHRKGLYNFCFYNRGSAHETVDFDVHIGHIPIVEHLKDEHIDPLMAQIGRLEEALYSVEFEQHWLQATTDQQASINKRMSRRILYKAILESVALVATSVLQVVLLRRLFEKRLGNSRV